VGSLARVKRMGDGVEIIVQIRAPSPDTHEDVPEYYTSECDIGGRSLEQFDSGEVVEDVMRTAVREVVAEWTEDCGHD